VPLYHLDQGGITTRAHTGIVVAMMHEKILHTH